MAHALNDPAMLQQMARIMSNPALLQEHMRGEGRGCGAGAGGSSVGSGCQGAADPSLL